VVVVHHDGGDRTRGLEDEGDLSANIRGRLDEEEELQRVAGDSTREVNSDGVAAS
jgi:hypothetical protein